jgi:hypothetical protein
VGRAGESCRARSEPLVMAGRTSEASGICSWVTLLVDEITLTCITARNTDRENRKMQDQTRKMAVLSEPEGQTYKPCMLIQRRKCHEQIKAPRP